MKPTLRCVVELQGYQGQGQGLLPAIRQAVQELQEADASGVREQLCDIGLSRQGDRVYLHLYYQLIGEKGLV